MLNNEDLELPELSVEQETSYEDDYNAAMDEEMLREHQREEELEFHRHHSLNSASQIIARKYPGEQYVIGPNILPKRGKMLITAETGVGKSYIALHIAACMATATPLFGLIHRRNENFGEPVFPVASKHFTAYLDYEIPDQQRQERLKALNERVPGFAGRVAFFKHASDYRLMNLRGEIEPGKGSFDRFYSELKDIKPDVLIIDPFSSTHSLNEISNEIKQPLNSIDRIIDHIGCACILIHHSSPKSKSDGRGKTIERSIKEMPRGHSSILDWCDSHLHLSDLSHGKGADSKTLQLDWGKVRYGRPPLSRQIELHYSQFIIEPFTL